MERLRYVARSSGVDAAVIVGETVDALRGLSPDAGELVSVCRNLVDRHITCGPLWWLCARLLSESDALGTSWDLADEIERDPTPEVLAHALANETSVLTVGNPTLAARALARRGDITVLAVEGGLGAGTLIRALDRSGVVSEIVPAEAALAAMAETDVVIIEAEAASPDVAICPMGSGLIASVARGTDTPVWLVAGRGRRLPPVFVDAIARRVVCVDPPWDSEYELVPTSGVSKVVGPDGVQRPSATSLAAECVPVPELIPTDRTSEARDPER